MKLAVKETRLYLADRLMEVAERYFLGDPTLYTGCGICLALDEYVLMDELMEEMGEPKPFYDDYSYSREKWEPRAWMCIFLAEYLNYGEEQCPA